MRPNQKSIGKQVIFDPQYIGQFYWTSDWTWETDLHPLGDYLWQKEGIRNQGELVQRVQAFLLECTGTIVMLNWDDVEEHGSVFLKDYLRRKKARREDPMLFVIDWQHPTGYCFTLYVGKEYLLFHTVQIPPQQKVLL